MTLLFIKIYYSLLYHSRVAIFCKCKRGREEGYEHRLTENSYIDTFLNYFVSLYSVSYVFASLTRVSRSGSARGRLPPLLWALACRSPNLTDLTALPTEDWLFCLWVSMYIYFYNAYAFLFAYPSSAQLRDLLPLLSCLHNCYTLFINP